MGGVSIERATVPDATDPTRPAEPDPAAPDSAHAGDPVPAASDRTAPGESAPENRAQPGGSAPENGAQSAGPAPAGGGQWSAGPYQATAGPSDAWPVYWYSYPAAPLPAEPAVRRRRRGLIAICVVWALLLLGTGTWYSFHGRPSIREQTTIGQAEPVVNTAAGWVLRAAGGQPVAALGGFARADSCDITPVRNGEEWVRGLRLATVVGGEAALLRQIAAGLPEGYGARVHPGPSPTLDADAGDYVSVRAAIEAPGVLHVQISTGCRSVGDRPAADPATAAPGVERAAVEADLAALGATASRWETHELSCAGIAGGVRTVTATVVDTPVGALDKIQSLGGTPVVGGEHVAAVRDGDVGTLLRNFGGTLTISATTGTCA